LASTSIAAIFPRLTFTLGQPSLDEVFLALTGHPAEEQAPTIEEEQAA
jgi:ABC-2 type transport system ATP-binding protein